MGVEKMSVSFDLELGSAIRTSAEESSLSVSAWLAEAARAQLRRKALGDAVAAWERKYGRLSEQEVKAAATLLSPATGDVPHP